MVEVAVDAAGRPIRDVHVCRAGRARRPRPGRGGPRRLRTPAGARDHRRRDRPTARRGVAPDRRSGPRRRPAAAAARARALPHGSPTTTWRRRPWSSGRCCRRGCSSGWSSSRSWHRPARRPTGEAPAVVPGDTANADLLDQLAAGPAPVRDLAGPDGRAGLLRRLRGLSQDGVVSLEWVLTGAGAGPRYERWIRLLSEGRTGRDAAGDRRAARRPTARTPPGRRARGARREPNRGAARGGPRRSPRDRPRSPGSFVAGSSRPRSASVRAGRLRPGRSGRRGGRPPSSELLPAQAEAVERVRSAIAARNPRPLLLDGVTGSGKTAIYVEAIAAALGCRAAGPGARAGDRPRAAAGRSAAPRPRRPGRAAPFRSRRRRARRRVAPDPCRRRGHRRRDAARGRSRRSPTSGSSSSTRSTTRPTRATGRRGSRLATRRSGWRRWRARRSSSGRRRRRSTASAGPGSANTTGSCCPARPVGTATDRSRSSTCARSSRPASAACCRARSSAAIGGARYRRRRAGDPGPQPARDGIGRAVPRLRSRPGLPGLRAAARLPPGRDDAALPPLRAGDPARVAVSGVRLAAHPLPRRRHGTRRARGPRDVPRAARRASRSRRRRATGAAERVIDAFSEGRLDVLVGTSLVAKGLDIPSVTLVGHRLVRRRAQPARRTRRRADLPAAGPGDRARRPRRTARATRSSRPTSRTIRRSWPPRRATGRRSTTPSSPCASGSARRRSGASSS